MINTGSSIELTISLVRTISSNGFPTPYTENIHRGLRQNGIESKVVQFASSNFLGNGVISSDDVTIRKRLSKMEYNLVLGLFLPRYQFRDTSVVHLIEPNLLSFVKPNSRTVITIHDLYFFIRQKGNLSKRIFRLHNAQMYKASEKAQYVITVSDFSRREILTKTHLNPNKVRRIYPIIDTTLFTAGDSSFRRDYKIENSDILLLNVSGPGERKNLKFLLRAISELPEKYKLVHVGNLSKEDELLICKMGVSNKLINIDRTSTLMLRDIYRASDIYVHPSLFEGFGMPIAEAMASGCFVMGANNTSIPEVIGNSGILFDPRDMSNFCELILQYNRDDEFYARKREEARARSLRFSTESIMPELIDIYRKVIS